MKKCIEIAIAFHESPYLYDEIEDVLFVDGKWYVKATNGRKLFTWEVIDRGDGDYDFMETTSEPKP